MKKKLLKSALVAVVGVGLMAGSASAVLVTTNFTGDNIIDTFYLQEGVISQNLGAGGETRSDWKVADTYSIDLKAGVNYSFIWKVTNAGSMGGNNPAGFLGDIDFGGSENYFSGITWTYAIEDAGTTLTDNFNNDWVWNNVTAYAYNGEPGAIWTNVLGGAVPGISTQAQWIWSEDNFTASGDQQLYIRADFTPVPEPTTLLLFGSGLLGLAAISRRRRNKEV